MPVADVVREAVTPRLWALGWDEVPVTREAKTTVRGPPGVGKSTIGAAVGTRLAYEARVPVLLLSTEEGIGVTAVGRLCRVAKMQGFEVPPQVVISDVRDVREADEDIARFEERFGGEPGLIIVDSLTHLRASPIWTRDLLASRHGVLLVLHVTSSGDPRGGLEPEFLSDVNLVVGADGRAEVRKSRFGPTGRTFDARRPPRVPRRPDDGAVIPFPRRTP